MMSLRRPPTFMPTTPWSQPWMTFPWPSVNWNGFLPLDHEESNSLPFLNRTPTYWTETVSPDLAAGPVPTMRSCASSFVGGLPGPLGTFGFLLRSASPGDGLTTVAVTVVSVPAVGFGCEAACWSACLAYLSAALSFVEPPQPAATSAVAASARAISDRV